MNENKDMTHVDDLTDDDDDEDNNPGGRGVV